MPAEFKGWMLMSASTRSGHWRNEPDLFAVVWIAASIEEPAVIRAILGHFEKHGAMEEAHYRPPAHAPHAAAACAAGHKAYPERSRRTEGENETTTRCGREPQG